MQPEYLIERKKLKREILNWKIVAIICFAVFMTVGMRVLSGGKNFMIGANSIKNDYIASIYIDGIIKDDKQISESLTKILDDDAIKALVVYINSPGGSSGASEELYQLIRQIGLKKPTACVMNEFAASGGYMASLAADYIVAHNSTITGSIGVYFQSYDLTDAAQKLGVASNMFRSGLNKGVPNPLIKVTPEVEEAIMASVNDVYDYFVELIVARRGLPKEYVKQLADGRIYTGRQAFDLKLVDCIGGTADALKWLQESKSIDKTLKIVEFDIKPKTLLQKLLGDDYLEQKVHSFFNKGKIMLM